MESRLGSRIDAAPESDIFLTSIQGFNAQLKRFFNNRNVPVVASSSETQWRALATKNKKITFPFFAVWPGEIDENTTGYNSFALRKRGVLGPKESNTGRGDKQQVYQVYHLSPATVTLNVGFTTDTIDDVYKFCPRWLTAARHHFLDFDLEPGGGDYPIRIKVDLATNTQFPDTNLDDEGTILNVLVTATLSTYHGSIAKRLTCAGIKFNFDLVQSIKDTPELTAIFSRFGGLDTNS